MLKRLLAGGLLAGLGAGVLAAVLQLWLTVPLILEAELYETGVLTHFAPAQAEATSTEEKRAAVAAHEKAHQEEEGALRRHVLTFSADLVTWTAFAILLSIAISLAQGAGLAGPLDWRRGIVWGICGFLAVHLAPAAGLPPELPGSSAAPLAARQIWWTATVILTAAGIAFIAFGRGWWPVALGLGLVLLPHLAGAPHPEEFGGVVPPELQGLFVGRALAVNGAAWLVMGALAGLYWGRQRPDA